MLVDVVGWKNPAAGCSRCAASAGRYVAPYWASNCRLCSACCIELARLYDQQGWPPVAR